MLECIKKLLFIINAGGVISFMAAALKGSARNRCVRGGVKGDIVLRNIGEGIQRKFPCRALPPLFPQKIEAGDETMAILFGRAWMRIEIEESIIERIPILIPMYECGIELPEKFIGWHRNASIDL